MSIDVLLGGLFPAGGANQQAAIDTVADKDRGGPALPNGSVVPRAVVKAAEELVRVLDLRLDGAAEVTIVVPRQSGLAALLPPQGLLLAPGLRVFGEES